MTISLSHDFLTGGPFVKSFHATVLFAAIMLVVGPVTDAEAGPKTLKEWSEHKKLPKKMQLGNHKPIVKKLKEQELRPKTVGLITFAIWDTGSYKYSAMAHTYGGVYETKTYLTPDGANHFATKFAETGVAALKKAFAAHDMQLLEPIEFAKTSEQQEVYREFEVEVGGLMKGTLATVDFLKKNKETTAAATGYKFTPAHLSLGDKKTKYSLEELRVAMGVDAVAVLITETYSDKKNVATGPIRLVMWGHNPVPKPGNKLARISWAPSAPYADGFFTQGGLNFAKMRKGEIESEDYAGYDVIVETLADEVLKKFDEEFDKGKAPKAKD